MAIMTWLMTINLDKIFILVTLWFSLVYALGEMSVF